MPSFRTRPRLAGVNGIFQFLILRVRGRTRVQSRDRPATHLLSYPPASRGREWNFPIPLSPRAGTHAGTSSENNWYVADAGPPRSGGPASATYQLFSDDVPACVPARGERGIVKFHSRPRDAGGYESWGFAGGSLERTRVRPARGEEEFENSTHARGTRAGTKAGHKLVVLWTVPACVPDRKSVV